MMKLQQVVALRLDPVLWAKVVLGITPYAWQEPFLRAPRGADILALTSRQFGKTTAAAICLAHTAIYEAGTLSVIACPVAAAECGGNPQGKSDGVAGRQQARR